MRKIKDKTLDALINERIRRELKADNPTISERAADSVARFGGSWLFVISFTIACALWIFFNVLAYAFDPYPFILLNLFLSCLAAIQAPIIMMSNNRMSKIDRKRDEMEYKNTLRIHLEITDLLAKLEDIKLKTEELHKLRVQDVLNHYQYNTPNNNNN